MCDIKREMKVRARLIKGLVNALQSDAEYIFSDASNFDVICLTESLREAKDTVQKMTDSLTELEYLLYLTKQKENA